MEQNENDKDFALDFDVLKRLVDLVQSSKIGRIRVSKNGFEVEVESASQTVNGFFPGLKPGQQVVDFYDAKEKQKTKSDEEAGRLVSSPIVGTFYSSPAPGKPEFVQVGSTVKKGDVLFILESMKLMNEVKSEFDGVVKKIFVKSGEPVEYGQPIMLIE